MHSFTQEDLLLYAYNETSTVQNDAIRAALEADWALQEQFEAIKSSQQQLEPLNLSPRKKALDFIMEYAERSVRELSPEI